MELIILVIFSIIFTLVKSLVEGQGKGAKPFTEPKFEKYPVDQRPQRNMNRDVRRPVQPQKTNVYTTTVPQTPQPTTKTRSPAKQYKEDLIIQVQDVEDEIGSAQGTISFDQDEVVKGIIMSEILNAPRFKKPHKVR